MMVFLKSFPTFFQTILLLFFGLYFSYLLKKLHSLKMPSLKKYCPGPSSPLPAPSHRYATDRNLMTFFCSFVHKSVTFTPLFGTHDFHAPGPSRWTTGPPKNLGPLAAA